MNSIWVPKLKDTARDVGVRNERLDGERRVEVEGRKLSFDQIVEVGSVVCRTTTPVAPALVLVKTENAVPSGENAKSIT